MSTPGGENRPDNVSEADWAEQVVDVDPSAEEAGLGRVSLGRDSAEVNEADLAEQATGVYGDVDEYRG